MINFQILFTFSEKEKQQLYFRKKAELSSAFLLVQKKYLLYIMIPYLYRKTESIEYTVFHSSYFVRDSMFRKRHVTTCLFLLFVHIYIKKQKEINQNRTGSIRKRESI